MDHSIINERSSSPKTHECIGPYMTNKRNTNPKGWKTLKVVLSPEDYATVQELLAKKGWTFTQAIREIFKIKKEKT